MPRNLMYKIMDTEKVGNEQTYFYNEKTKTFEFVDKDGGRRPLTEEEMDAIKKNREARDFLEEEIKRKEKLAQTAKNEFEKEYYINEAKEDREKLEWLKQKKFFDKEKSIKMQKESGRRKSSDLLQNPFFSAGCKFFEEYRRMKLLCSEFVQKSPEEAKNIKVVKTNDEGNLHSVADNTYNPDFVRVTPLSDYAKAEKVGVIVATSPDGFSQCFPVFSMEQYIKLWNSEGFKKTLEGAGNKLQLITLDVAEYNRLNVAALSSDNPSKVFLTSRTAILEAETLVKSPQKLEEAVPLAEEVLMPNSPAPKQKSLSEMVQYLMDNHYNPQKHHFAPNKIDWKQLKEYGITPQFLLSNNLLEKFLQGAKSPIISLAFNKENNFFGGDFKLHLVDKDGKPVLVMNGVKSKLEIPDIIRGYKLTDVDKENLKKHGLMFKSVPTKDRNGKDIKLVIYVDKDIKKVCSLNIERFKIPNKFLNKELTNEEVLSIKEGKPTLVSGLVDKSGQTFSGWVYLNPQDGKLDISKKNPISIKEEYVPQVQANNNGVRTEELKRDKSTTIDKGQRVNNDPKPDSKSLQEDVNKSLNVTNDGMREITTQKTRRGLRLR